MKEGAASGMTGYLRGRIPSRLGYTVLTISHWREKVARMPADERSITRLLQDWSGGDKQALDTLMPLIYDQLRKIASSCLRAEAGNHTLQPTALVNEAYLRLVNAEIPVQDRLHFYKIAARMLRRILVDHARAAKRKKRGDGIDKVTLNEELFANPQPAWDILVLDMAMANLALHDQRKCDVIELLFFGGLTYDEVASALDISPATVHRELKMAKAYLQRELANGKS
jgi:RNA polymerase sigma factor (TIGR02999 family)